MPAAKKAPAAKPAPAKNAAGQRVTTIKLTDSVRGRVLKDLGIDAAVTAVPSTIQVVRMSRKDFPGKVASPAAWVLVMV